VTRRLPGLIVAAVLMLSACGGTSTTTSSAPTAHFTADTPNPGPATVALLQDATIGASVTLRVTVTGVPSFFGAAFRVNYDPNALLFAGWDTSSSFLSTGLVSPGDILFSEDHTTIGGSVVIVATRLDPTVETTIDVTTTATLVKLNFVARKALAVGAVEGRLDFGDPKQVCDGTVSTVDPLGCNPVAVTWSGGGLSAK
jgi:cohesin domain-containing protein